MDIEKNYIKNLNEAIMLQYDEKYDEALFILESLLENVKNDFVVYALLGQISFLQYKYDKAVTYFGRVLELKPKSESASSGLFHSLNCLGRGDDAMNEMIKFLNSKNELLKESYKWILQDLVDDIDNPQLVRYKETILKFKKKYNY